MNCLIRKDEVVLTTTTCEFDTHADTCVLGSNFRPTVFTGRYAETHLLVSNKGIYLGSKLDHSLLNPNQMRYFGVKVRDDPTEDGLGIHAEDAYIPFHMNGVICMAETRTPTLEELKTCNRIKITASIDW